MVQTQKSDCSCEGVTCYALLPFALAVDALFCVCVRCKRDILIQGLESLPITQRLNLIAMGSERALLLIIVLRLSTALVDIR
jgi:hypothetical protein